MKNALTLNVRNYLIIFVFLCFINTSGVPGEAVEITSEEDIFDYLDYPYRKPEERN